ncbi:MAG: diguanylate cyclase [Proteobacteria bacterium]|nr:diguanylate cyclase [Pseudomonadota bacterium]
MFTQNLLKSGWLHALFMTVIAYPVGTTIQKLVMSYTDIHVLVYTGFFMLSAATALLLVAGPGELANKTLRRPETWLYAILQISSYILFLLSMKYLSATEGSALGNMGGIFILFISITFLRQKTNAYELLGGALIISGFAYVIYNVPLPIEAKSILILLVFIRMLLQGFQKIIAELHKTNRKADSFKAQMRVTGFIMAVASFMYLVFLLGIAQIKSGYDIEFLKTFPDFSDFVHFQCVVIAFLVGFFIMSVNKYCEFYAGKTIGAKYLTSITSLELLFVYLIEVVLSKFEIINPRTFDHGVLPVLILILLGNAMISASGFFMNLRSIKKGKIQDTLKNMEHNFVEEERDFGLVKLNLINLLSLYDENSKKLSEEIQIDRVILDNIVNYDLEDFKLEKKIAKTINEFASHNVALKDKLTKAYNRYYLANKVKELLKGNIEFKLYMLDLNKFKYVNDTFGHPAGDATLVETVKRLNTLIGKKSVFRVGGDEFVLIQFDNLDEDLSDSILEKIEEPIIYENNKLEISTSIGLVQSSKYDDLDAMLAVADENMYKDKGSRGR